MQEAMSPQPHRATRFFATRFLWASVLAFAVLAVACTNDDTLPSPTASPPVTATPVPTAAASPTTPAPEPTPGAPRPLNTTLRLIDTATGESHMLLDSAELLPGYIDAEFEGDTVRVRIFASSPPQELTFDFAGIELSRQPWDHRGRCLWIDEGASEIDGVPYDINCGHFSPDGSKMLYTVTTGTTEVSAGYVVDVWDTWVFDIDSGERTLLQEGLRHCGGCDGVYGHEWSPTGRWVAFGEYYSGAGGSRIYLADTETGQSRLIQGGGGSEHSMQIPQWSPDGGWILYRSRNAETYAEEVATGRRVRLPEVVFAQFTADGDHVAGQRSGNAAAVPTEMLVVSIETGEVVAELAGHAPAYRHWLADPPLLVEMTPDGPIAFLDGVCDGMVAYHPAITSDALGDHSMCLVQAAAAVLSPDGEQVAFARQVGDSGPVESPAFSGQTLPVWRIEVLNLASGAMLEVTGELISAHAPVAQWDASGRYLLVLAPVYYGL